MRANSLKFELALARVPCPPRPWTHACPAKADPACLRPPWAGAPVRAPGPGLSELPVDPVQPLLPLLRGRGTREPDPEEARDKRCMPWRCHCSDTPPWPASRWEVDCG